MSISAGENIIGGKVVIVTFSDDKVATVVFPSWTDSANMPVTLTFSPLLVPMDAEAIINALLPLVP